MTRKLRDFSVLSFDCYGTLIDWESGIWDALQPLFMANRFAGTRIEALKIFGEAEHHHESKSPDLVYPQLLQRVHQDIADRLKLETSDALDQAFGDSVPHWPAFPDTAEALRILKKHYKLVILSNVNRDGFAASKRKLGVEFDAIYTAQDIGSYKPDPRNFEYMLSHLANDFSVDKADILHTAQSLRHDHVQARAFGLSNAWIDRQGLSSGGHWGATQKIEQMPDYDFLFASMGEMAEAVEAEGER